MVWMHYDEAGTATIYETLDAFLLATVRKLRVVRLGGGLMNKKTILRQVAQYGYAKLQDAKTGSYRGYVEPVKMEGK